MRNVAIWASMSVLAEFVAELVAAAHGGVERTRKALGELLVLEHLERRLGRAALGGYLAAKLGGRLLARGGELAGAEHGMGGELERLSAIDAGALGKGGELLDQPEHVSRAAARHGGHGVEQPLLLDPDNLPDRCEDLLRAAALLCAHLGQRIQAGDAGADERRRIAHAAHELAV